MLIADIQPPQLPPDPYDAAPYWEGIEWKRWVVAMEAGPYKRKKPAYKAVYHVQAKNKAGALIEAEKRFREEKRRRFPTARRPSFAARLAHPVRDLGLTPRPAAGGPAGVMPVGVDDGWRTSCKCGYCAPVEDFCKTPSGQRLPVSEWQCPKCFRAWRVEAITEAWMSPEGDHLPAQLGCVPIIPQV